MEIKKKVLFLMNRTSGIQNNNTNDLADIVVQLTLKGCLVTVYPIDPSMGLVSEDILSMNLEDYDVIACCGGDGTLNHVVSEMMKHGIHKPVGYIPAGSTNDFSRSINDGRHLSVPEHCDAIAGNQLFTYDVGKINDMYFNYIAAFGAFTKVSYDTPQDLKNAIGYGAYVLNVIANIPDGLTYRNHIKYTYNGVTEEEDVIFCGVANSTSIGGMESPLIGSADLNDGMFEVIMISAPNNILDVSDIVTKLTSGRTDDKHVKVFKTDHITFEFEKETVWTLDGEEGKTGNIVDITCIKDAMQIYRSER